MTETGAPGFRGEYVARINRVLDYIDAHLDQDLNLQVLARVANFSPFHFHRVFGALLGETLGRYIQRLRIEKAAGMLVTNRRKSVTAVALECGFSGSAAFARAFRDAFGMSATQWRSGAGHARRTTSQGDRDAWNAVFGGWLPESGYQPADGPCFELYLNNPEQHPEGKHVFDICVPVMAL